MLDVLIEKFSPQKIIPALHPFLTPQRIEGINHVLSQRMGSVHVGIEAPYDIHNGMAMIRTAEALGISHIHFINALMKKGQGKNTTKGTLKWTHLKRHDTFDQFLAAKGQFSLACAVADGEKTLEELPLDRPLCFLFGNEKEGLTEEALGAADFCFRIPMYGMVESLNVSVASAITLYDYLKRKRSFLGRAGDLTPEEIEVEKARFYIRSVGIEEASQILQRSV